jgi:hypothetical protein
MARALEKLQLARLLLTAIILAVVFFVSHFAWAQDVPAPVDFEHDVAPLLVRRCLECHQESSASGGLVLSRGDRALTGGDSGETLVPGKPEASLLLDRVIAGEMPPEKRGVAQNLPAAEIDILRHWIAQGAVWPQGRVLDLYERTSDVRAGRDWWSLQPVQRITPPPIVDPSRGLNPVDAFWLQRLDENGLTPAPSARPEVLARRVYLDLIGLPPTAEEIDAFVKNPSNDAYARLVDHLLDSPHYGERWARHWLDVVRFAETSGYERDQEKPFAWKYRDWVVQVLNEDLPYDQFIVAQLAGDELENRSEQSTIATGFLRLGTWNDEPNDPQDYKYERLEDLVHATASAFLGLTVKCARCHDHKFDPIPQVDYYRMAAAFWSGPIEPRDRELLGGPTEQELGYQAILGWTDVTSSPGPLHLLKNGERNHPQQAVAAASLSFAPNLFCEFAPPAAGAKTAGRRLRLAQWIADPQNPLTARVIVNRVFQHHMGHGLVRSPDNFGFTGERPTHPELLDWLTAEFLRHGWRLKPLHRLIATSSLYRQSSLHPQHHDYHQRDPNNRLWWRAERRRVDAETLRDSLLAASGELDRRLGGPSFRPSISPEALEGLSRKASAWQASPSAEQRRRSLYMFTQRSLLPPMMTAFDFSDTTLPCGQRDVTTVAPQALTLLNNQFSHDRALELARRTLEGSNTAQGRIMSIWRAVLGRGPNPLEERLAMEHVKRQQHRFATMEQDPAPSSDESRSKLPTAFKVTDVLTLHLRADLGVEVDAQGQVSQWTDSSSRAAHATQAVLEHRPRLVANALQGLPVVRFTGDGRFLNLAGTVLSGPYFTIFAVVSDRGSPGHRTLLSNWSGKDGNSTRSIFLGLTGERTVRLSDQFASAGEIADRERPFLFTAVSGSQDAAVYLQGVLLASLGAPLSDRRLDTPWVLGQQGNIDGEYWNGDLAELLVFDRELSETERRQVEHDLAVKYGLPRSEAKPNEPPDAETLAWASLCLTLFNTNEFLYVD